MPDTPAPIALKEPAPGEAVDEPKKEYKRIPEDTELIAEVRGVQIRKMPFNEKDREGNDLGVPAERFEFEFKIVEEGDWKNYRVWGETFKEFERKSNCRLYQWVQELYGQELGPDFVLKFEDLIGMKARIKIGIATWEKKDGSGQGSKNFVRWVSRLRGDEPEAAGTPAAVRASTTAPAYADEEPF